MNKSLRLFTAFFALLCLLAVGISFKEGTSAGRYPIPIWT